MRKILAVLISVLAVVILLPLSSIAQAATDYDWIKVKLSTEGASTISMTVSGNYFIQENGKSFSGGTLTVNCNGMGQVTVSHSSSGPLYTGASVQIKRESIKPSAGFIRVPTVHGNRAYLGHFNIKSTSSGLQVVNELPLAHYLYGVVGHEMSNAFPLEALKAQAVVSKCYVLSGMKTSGDYYIGDTSADQVYKGYDSSATNVIKAVNSTLDVVIKSGSRILKTYYAASNGGETNLVSYAWSSSASNAGYAVDIDKYDMANPSAIRETAFIPYNGGSMSAAMNNYLLKAVKAALGQSASILSVDEVETHSPKYSGVSRNLTKARITMTVSTGAASSGTASGGTVDSGFGGGFGSGFGSGTDSSFGFGLGSDGFGFGNSSSGFGTSFNSFGSSFGSGFGSSFGGFGSGSSSVAGSASVSNVSIRDNEDATKTLTFDFLLSDLSANGIFTNDSLRIMWGEETSNGYTIYHVRYGHGVGMSQRGAQQRAKDGQSYKDILKFYYPTAKLATIDVDAPKDPVKPEIALEPIAYGSINAKGVNLRKKPVDGSRITKLSKGTEVTVYEETNGWYYISAGKYKGYVSEDYVDITSRVEIPQITPDTGNSGFGGFGGFGMGSGSSFGGTNSGFGFGSGNDSGFGFGGFGTSSSSTSTGNSTSAGTDASVRRGIITGDQVNIRQFAGTANRSLGKLSIGTEVIILGESGTWYRVQVGNLVGFVISDYVREV